MVLGPPAPERARAARDGRVVCADYLSGYGNTIILDHEDNYFTIYAQNASLLVKLDDVVSKGSKVIVDYTGMFEDGTVFDTSKGREPIKFTVGNNEVVKGFDVDVAASFPSA